jgi:SAM-dependent methyltransferase
MSFFFRIAAPLFKHSSRRWTDDDFAVIAERLRPYVAPGGRLLDLGGGTGDLGAGVAQALGATVVVADATPRMLALVEPHPLVSTCLASAEALPFSDSHFDAVLCCDAFHHFVHQDAAAAEIARVVRPEGGVMLLEMWIEGWGRLLVLGERLVGEPAGFKTPYELERLFALHGIEGASERQGGWSYMFVGRRSAGAGVA